MTNVVQTSTKIQRGRSILGILRAVLGAWIAGRPVFVAIGIFEVRCEGCGRVTMRNGGEG